MDRRVCLDSDIIIDFLREKPNIKKILENLQEEEFCTTQINIFEIWSGRMVKEEDTIKNLFSSLVKFDFDENSAVKAGNIQVKLRKKGETIDFRDLFIASICIANNLELLTNNKKHFERLKKHGLKLI